MLTLSDLTHRESFAASCSFCHQAELLQTERAESLQLRVPSVSTNHRRFAERLDKVQIGKSRV